MASIERAEQRSAGESATIKAHEAHLYNDPHLPGRALLPDVLMSVSCMRRASWQDQWKAKTQRWMLIDLDDVEGLDRCSADLGERLSFLAMQDPEVGGSVAVVRTGPTGIQVWVELEPARHSPVEWCQLPEVRRWHAELGELLLDECHRQGVRLINNPVQG